MRWRRPFPKTAAAICTDVASITASGSRVLNARASCPVVPWRGRFDPARAVSAERQRRLDAGEAATGGQVFRFRILWANHEETS